jgi:hypothetical protein
MIAVVCNLLTINVQVFIIYYNSDRYALHGIDVIILQTTDSATCIRSKKGWIHHFRARFFVILKVDGNEKRGGSGRIQ